MTAACLADEIAAFLRDRDLRERAARNALTSMADPDGEFSPAVFERNWLELFQIRRRTQVAAGVPAVYNR
jgi:hypothetical protein